VKGFSWKRKKAMILLGSRQWFRCVKREGVSERRERETPRVRDWNCYWKKKDTPLPQQRRGGGKDTPSLWETGGGNLIERGE